MHSQQNSNFISHRKDHFARLFPELEPLELTDRQCWNYAERMMDWGEMENPDSSSITNGVAIFSQFLAHDITFDANSRLRSSNRVPTIANDRTINLDLDCIYGQRTQDFYYDAEDKDKLLLGKHYEEEKREWWDLQRNAQGKAIIADSRNDENILVSRQQVLFIAFHNAMVEHLRDTSCPDNVFAAARREVIWYYHWLILHEFLDPMLDPSIFNRLKREPAHHYRLPTALPLEFTGAAFRVGHSQTRDRNRINAQTDKKLFDLGFFSAMEEWVDWRYLFDFGDGRVQYARKLDTQIGRSFHCIPFIQTKDKKEQSLPFRNIRRGVSYGLPSGEAVAMRLGYEPLEVPLTKKLRLSGTPLWFYLLYEAETVGNAGEHLGPVGSTILGECFMTIMREDEESFLKRYPRWRPELGRNPHQFDFVDLIQFVEKYS
ncbi:MAG: peroxidase family protein [Bacteroidota bacterium]